MPGPSRRDLLRLAGAAVLGAAACGPHPTGPKTASPSPTPSPSGSPSPAPSLLTPGLAAKVVEQLRVRAGNEPVIQVTITASRATVSVVQDDQAKTWAWDRGVIGPGDSDIQYVRQASFDPSAFNLSDVRALFAEAKRLSGSDSNQQLQIVEYNQGQVLMSVATNPESATVFFRSDGSAVHSLDLSTEAGLIEGLRDASGSSTYAVAVGCTPNEGLWVETPGEQGGVVNRRTRPPKLPARMASQKDSAADWAPFQLDLVDPVLIAALIKRLPGDLGKDALAPVSWQLDRRDNLAAPLLRLYCGGSSVAYNLQGVDVTRLVNP